MKTITQAQFNELNAADKLTVSNDPTITVEAETVSVFEATDLVEASNAKGEFNDNVYLNIDVVVNGKKLRITGVRLDSAYVQYTDKEHTKKNMNAASLLQTVVNKGVTESNDKLEFDVTITKQGETSGLNQVVDLF